MKRILGITFGGVQKKAINLVLTMMLTTMAIYSCVFLYSTRMLSGIVAETRDKQQEAIADTSEETMQQVAKTTLIKSAELQAELADVGFSEMVNDVNMLQTIAKGLYESRDSIEPVLPTPPDPSMEGTPTIHVLSEKGVDYTQSEYLGILSHMSDPMLAMFGNNDKIEACYIGLADGTFLDADDNTLDKYDENGELKDFPVRQRPWYIGAVEAGGLYFSGIITDAFNGKMVVTCAEPVVADGEMIGVVAIDVVLQTMGEYLTRFNDESYVYVVNEEGEVIFCSEGDGLLTAGTPGYEQNLLYSKDKDVKDFIDESVVQTGFKTLTINGEEYYLAGAPMPTVGWAVITAVDKERTELPAKAMISAYDEINDYAREEYYKGSSRIRTMTILVLLANVILGLAAALYATRRMVQPIEEMTKSIIHSSKTGNLFVMKDTYRTNDEIELLAEAFDDLSKKTKRYIEEITEITREKERIGTELRMANLIQKSMLPHIFPAFPDRPEFDLYATMNPAKEVGGDFYDFFLIDDDHLCMVIADVSGKGVPAALFMMVSKVILQSCAMLGLGAGEIIRRTNEALCSSTQVDMFVTVWLSILEISSGKLVAVNAGHEYPVINRGECFELMKDTHSFVIGGIDGVPYTEYELRLEPGDKIFVYTDGVPEATDASYRMFGMDAMLEALNREPDASPEQILVNVRSAVDDFVKDAEQFDDLTMLCIEYNGPGKVITSGDTEPED